MFRRAHSCPEELPRLGMVLAAAAAARCQRGMSTKATRSSGLHKTYSRMGRNVVEGTRRALRGIVLGLNRYRGGKSTKSERLSS